MLFMVVGKFRIVSAKDLYDFAKKQGYEEIPGRGKGSHIVMQAEGRRKKITIPSWKKSGGHVGKNVIRRVVKRILNQEEDMPQEVANGSS